MTREQPVERRISEWLHEEASGQLPDWVLETTFERTRTERQRRGFSGWRTLPVIPRSNVLRIVLVAALLGVALLGIAVAVGQKAPQTACASSPGAASTAGGAPTTVASPAEYLWSATGPADDPMSFSRSSYATGSGPIAIDPTCRIWVADTANDRFAIFDQSGAFVEYWQPADDAAGKFDLANAYGDGLGTVAFAPDGSFYVLDQGNNRVQHFDKNRKHLGSWNGSGTDAGRFKDAGGLAVDAKGVVYVLDDARDVVETYDKDGHVLTSFSPHLPGALTTNGMKLDAQGDIYVVACCEAGNEVRKFDPQGRLLAKIGSIGGAGVTQIAGVAIDAAGRVYTLPSGPGASGDVVHVFDKDGNPVASFGSTGSGDGQFGPGWVFGIALDGQGNVYLTDPGKNRLEKFRLLPPIAP
jgi:hypothetical protein